VLWGGNGLSYWLTSCCQKNNKPKKFFGSGASRVRQRAEPRHDYNDSFAKTALAS